MWTSWYKTAKTVFSIYSFLDQTLSIWQRNGQIKDQKPNIFLNIIGLAFGIFFMTTCGSIFAIMASEKSDVNGPKKKVCFERIALKKWKKKKKKN